MTGKRLFDVIFAAGLAAVLFIPMLLIGLMVRLGSRGPVLYVSERMGRDNRSFKMYKFRTMRTNAPVVATHLLARAEQYLAPGGRFLRKTSLDELPQLINIIKGEMSFVGPRPALFNQFDLMELRTARGIHRLTPGLTGLAQVNGRDELPIPEKVEYDRVYLEKRSFGLDLKILLLTLKKVITKEGVSH
ncbi:MAG: sugar transferase [bacterium]|nr:sugar transferase [bacterium]